MTQFVGVVLAETEDVWNGIFQAEGLKYEEPQLVLFAGQVKSACGYASSASGPFYCPGDRKVYLDTSFFDQLDRQFGASGDFAQAYVIAHEVGHHIQNLTGILPKFNQMRQSMSEAEANADVDAGRAPGRLLRRRLGPLHRAEGLLEQGDVEEALNAAQQIGDDTLQKRTQGYVVPGKLQPRHVRAAPEMVRGRAAVGQAVVLRHVQQPDLRATHQPVRRLRRA